MWEQQVLVEVPCASSPADPDPLLTFAETVRTRMKKRKRRTMKWMSLRRTAAAV